jgi:tumor protein p53-inducible protein 3
VGRPSQAAARALGAAAGLNYKSDPAFAAFVKAHTDGRGADLVLDCVGGAYWEQNVDAYARAPMH